MMLLLMYRLSERTNVLSLCVRFTRHIRERNRELTCTVGSKTFLYMSRWTEPVSGNFPICDNGKASDIRGMSVASQRLVDFISAVTYLWLPWNEISNLPNITHVGGSHIVHPGKLTRSKLNSMV
jgi:hypothetical protein